MSIYLFSCLQPDFADMVCPRIRQQTFEHHVQSFAVLLNKALADPDNESARQSLDRYCFVQSTPKIYRRLNRQYSPWLNELFDLKPSFNHSSVPSPTDQGRIRAILITNKEGVELHRVLRRFLGDPPAHPQEWLPKFHEFFTWFLRIVVEDLKALRDLRVDKVIPPLLPERTIDRAFHNLVALQYFSWQSQFFTAYISLAFAAGTMDPAAIVPANRTDAQLPHEPEEWSQGEAEQEPGEVDMGPDISTEFETGDGQQSMAARDDIHPCVLELRLISSNIKNLKTIISQAPRSRFRFQVIQYPPSGHSLKPWRDLIQELFPQKELREKILQALTGQFKCFRPGGPALQFKGQAHCEAVLGCLFSLTKRGEDYSWVIDSY